MHACALAEELGMSTVLVPRACGVLSALGLAISDLRRDYVKPLLRPLDLLDEHELEAGLMELARSAQSDLDNPECRALADLRYRGQSFELSIRADEGRALERRFHDAHERRYGYSMPDEPIELVALRLVAAVRLAKPSLWERPAKQAARPAGQRTANFGGQWRGVGVYAREEMGAGSMVEGPCIVDFPEATCVVEEGWRGAIDEVGSLVLSKA